MAYDWIQLGCMLILILVSAVIFTNALEYFGEKFGISQGVVGSIFAAVGTALPETTIPVLAIIAGTADKHANEEISVGAILGAPLMLSTLSIFLMTLFAIEKRGFQAMIRPERVGFVRDLHFFIVAFILAASAMYIPHHPFYLRFTISILLIFLYVIYLAITIKASKQLVKEGHGISIESSLLLTQIGMAKSTSTILIQLILGLTLLLIGAKGFIDSVEHISKIFNFSPLILSLLVVPVATELPEKVNSILWIRKRQDTLALGNITGAMVFQGSLLPAIGILLTPWEPSREVILGIVTTVIATLWIRINTTKNGIPTWSLLINGIIYITYLWLAIG